MIRVEVIGRERLEARFQNASDRMLRAVVEQVRQEWFGLQAAVVQQRLSGQVLRRRTGTLASSIHAGPVTRFTQDAQAVTGYVGTNVRYARIHEYGGRTPPHVIEPKNAKALRFMVGGAVRFARRVNHPGSQMPERSFLRSTLEARRDGITRRIRAAVAAQAEEA